MEAADAAAAAADADAAAAAAAVAVAAATSDRGDLSPPPLSLFDILGRRKRGGGEGELFFF